MTCCTWATNQSLPDLPLPGIGLALTTALSLAGPHFPILARLPRGTRIGLWRTRSETMFADPSGPRRRPSTASALVDPRQVASAFGLQPIENSRVEAYAYRYLPPNVPHSHHACQLLIGKTRDVFEIETRFVSGCLARSGAAEYPPLLFGPSPVPDIFGFHAFQAYGPR